MFVVFSKAIKIEWEIVCLKAQRRRWISVGVDQGSALCVCEASRGRACQTVITVQTLDDPGEGREGPGKGQAQGGGQAGQGG